MRGNFQSSGGLKDPGKSLGERKVFSAKNCVCPKGIMEHSKCREIQGSREISNKHGGDKKKEAKTLARMPQTHY